MDIGILSRGLDVVPLGYSFTKIPLPTGAGLPSIMRVPPTPVVLGVLGATGPLEPLEQDVQEIAKRTSRNILRGEFIRMAAVILDELKCRIPRVSG